jgi:hypothetical protein
MFSTTHAIERTDVIKLTQNTRTTPCPRDNMLISARYLSFRALTYFFLLCLPMQMQVPQSEVVPLSTLAEQQGDDFVEQLVTRAKEALATGQGAAGGGVRANYPTQEGRLYEDTASDSFERSVYIDQDRRGALRYDAGEGGGDIDLGALPVAREEILKGGQNMKVPS